MCEFFQTLHNFNTGYNSGAFYAFSKLLKEIAQSACHAELFALDQVTRFTIHFRTILQFLNHTPLEPTKIYIDNQAAIRLCEVLKITHKTASVSLQINFIREFINNKTIELHFIPTQHNVADILTKAICLALYLYHTQHLHHGFNGVEDMSLLLTANTTQVITYIVHEDYINDVLNIIKSI